VIAGEGGFFTLPDGCRGAMLRARQGHRPDAGAVYMPAPQTGSLMTYMLNGKRIFVLAIGGGNYSAELVAYKLPEDKWRGDRWPVRAVSGPPLLLFPSPPSASDPRIRKHEARRGKTRRRQYRLLFGLAPTSRRHRVVAGGGVLVRSCHADS
jgi:hypothetical protein